MASLLAYRVRVTFGTDAAQICNLHKGLGEHQGHAGPALTGIDL